MLWALLIYVAAQPGAAPNLDANMRFTSIADCRIAQRDVDAALAGQGVTTACVALQRDAAIQASRTDWSQHLRHIN